MRRAPYLVVIVSLLLQLLAPALDPSVAYAQGDEGANAIAGGLQSLAYKLDELAYVGALGDLLPLAATSVSDDLGLALSHLFGDTLGALGTSPGSLAALEAAIVAASGNAAGTEITFSDVVSSTAGSVTHLSFSVSAAHVDSLIPVAYYTDTVPLDLYGGGITTTFELSTAFSLAYDASETYAPFRLALDVTPTIEITVSASGPIAAFEGLFGFAEIGVGGEVTLSEQIAIDFVDPDDDGRITQDEWEHTAILDLVRIGYGAASSVDALLELEAQPVTEGGPELIPGSPDGSLQLYDGDWSDGLADPSYALGDLGPFGNVKADDVLAGLAQVATALMAAQIEADAALPGGRLPFLEESFGDAFSIVTPLQAFIAEQGEAYILCGTANTDPPSGDASHLGVGETFYCQAPTVVEPDTVDWAIDSGTVLGNETAIETVGPNPSANVVFSTSVAGPPQVVLTFYVLGDPSPHTVRPRFRSLQELYAKLSDPRFGFDAAPGNVAYAPDTYALTYRLSTTVDADAVTAHLGFADRLKPDTGLYALEATGSASAEMDAGSAALDLAFGVILVDDPAEITPGEFDASAGLEDRFFLGVHAGPEIELEDIVFTTTLKLDGLLGYVDVHANQIDSQIARSSSAAPALTVEINPLPEGIPISGTSGIASAVQIRRILSDTTGLVAPTINLSMTAALDVSSTLDEGTVELGRGTVSIDWPDVTAGPPQVTTSPDFVETLSVYDVVPSIYGTATVTVGMVLTDTLYDPEASFGDDPIGRELRNLDDGSRCLITGRSDAHTLTCASGLASGALNRWNEGDLYEIVGDPTALREVVLGGIYGLAARMEAITPTQVISSELYLAPLPLIGVSPSALATQFATVRDAIEAVGAGVPDAVIQCGITNTVPLTGSLSELTLSDPGRRTTFYCQATTPDDLPVTAVEWSAIGATHAGQAERPGDGPGTLSETVALTPTARAVFDAVDPAGIQVSVVFTDSDGRHSATYPPPSLPPSLQRLEAAVESKLGLQPSALSIATDELAHYAASGEIRQLTISLQKGICTEGHPGCGPTDQRVPATGIQVQVDLSDQPDLIGLERTDTAQLTYASVARFDLAFPLTDTIPITEVAVLESTGLTMTIDVSSTVLDFNANMGPLSLAVGMGAAMTGTHQLTTLIGAHTGLTSTTTMTDSGAAFLSDWGLITGTLTTITNTQAGKGGSCQVAALTDTVVTCDGALSGEQKWVNGDPYALCGPSTLVLYDPDPTRIFIDELVGQVLYNVTDGSWCTVGERVDDHTLRCESPLQGGADNAWSAGDVYKIGAVGRLAFAGQFSLLEDGVDLGGPVDTFSVEQYVNGLRASLSGHNPGAECGDGVEGDACLRVSLLDRKASDIPAEPYLRVLKVAIPDLSDPDPASWDVLLPSDVTDRIGLALLDFERLTFALDPLRGSLYVALDGNEVGLMLPFLGTQLDAGAEIAQRLRTEMIAPLQDLGSALNALGTTATASMVSQTISDTIVAALGNSGSDLLLGDVDVTLLCGTGGECAGADSVWDIDDIRVSFTVGSDSNPQKGCADDSCLESHDIPFDVGLPNVALYSDDMLQAEVGWALSVTFGISRSLGAYLDVGGPDDPADLVLGAAVGFKNTGSGCADVPQGLDPFAEYESPRCLSGQIGILPVDLRDSEVYTSSLRVAVSIYLLSKAPAGSGAIAYGELEQLLTASLELDAEGEINLYFRSTFGFGSDEPYGFPTVLGTFRMVWDPKHPGADGYPVSELLFDNLYLDPGSFINGFLEPLVGGVQRVTKPLQPPIDVITTPLPVVSDISKLGGGGPVTLFTLMKAISGNDLTLVERLIGFIQFVNHLPQGGVLFALGEDNHQPGTFSLDTLIARTTGFVGSTPPSASQPCYMEMPPDEERAEQCVRDTLKEYNKIKQELEKEEGELARKEQQRKEKQEANRKENTRTKRETNARSKVSALGDLKTALKNHTKVVTDVNVVPPSVSFPFLEDSRQIFYALLGQDVTLIRVDLGSVSAMAGVYFKFRVQAGPVPISVIIGGSATISGRFAMGYDTRGFAPLLSGRAGFESLSGSSLLDGIFLDDFDAAGNDVPEVELVIEVSIAGAVDLGIVSAGIEAGVIVAFALDFDDRLHDPPGSGKLRITTIANIENPFCLFVFSGKGELFFKVFIEINLFLFKKKWSWEPFPRVELFKFEIKCEPPDPVLASQVGVKLTLNMGSPARRRARAAFKDREDERFIVRQLTASNPATVSVAAFGYIQVYADVAEIEAYGDSGNDTILLEPGKDPDSGDEVPFTLRSHIEGGDGNEVINTGDGNDVVHGGPGNDRISTRGGNDQIWGDADNDTLDGGIDDDVIYGGGQNDSISGGPGSDYMDGGAGEDYIDGGPGTEEGSGEPGIPDLEDILIGGGGEDTLRGHFGDDLVFGGTAAACATPIVFTDCYAAMGVVTISAGSDGDTIDGAEGHDRIVGADGDDLITGGPGSDTVYANGGDDVIDADDDNNRTVDGDDTVYAGDGDDVIYGRGGNDDLHGGADRDDLIGGPGRDRLYGDGQNDFLMGDSGTVPEHDAADHDPEPGEEAWEDLIALSVPDNALHDGFAIASCDPGDPKPSGGGNGDCLLGGPGNDIMFGEGGYDRMYGDAPEEALDDGADVMQGSRGEDYMMGGGGADTMRGGLDDDEMYGGTGDDVMYGDSGEDYMEGNEDVDTMRGGIGEDDVLGGGLPQWTSDDAGDEIYGDEGDDVILGDIGVVPVDTGTLPDYSRRKALDFSAYYSGTLEVIQTISPTVGLSDTIRGHVGTDILLGGAAGDDIYGSTGTDYVVGDGGRVYRDTGGIVHRVQSADPCTGGEDTIYGNEEPDILVGGDANDEIYGDDGDDTILGDNGVIVLIGDHPDVHSTYPDCGGSDTIEGNNGVDIVLGGSGGTDLLGTAEPGDTIGGYEGDDILLGDNGRVYRSVSHVVLRIASTFPDKGGDDIIAGHEGADVILGGNDGDALTGDGAGVASEDEGDDILLGDNGVVVRADGSAQAHDVYSSDPEYGGSDTIYGNGGDDIVLGGSGGTDVVSTTVLAGDVISGNLGADILLGDNGYITRTLTSSQSVVLGVDSTYPDMGAGDTIYGHEGDDVILGVSDADALFGHEQDDILLGDSGRLDYEAGDGGSLLLFVTTTDPTIGGGDTISCGLGIDLAFGGTAGDVIDGGDDHDILLGDHGELDNAAGPVDQPFQCIDTGTGYGGGVDTIHGDAGDDFILGEQDGDHLYGDAGDDDITGGHNVPGGADGDDTMYGERDVSDGAADGSGADVMLGDNGVITRALTMADTWKNQEWYTDTFNSAVRRVVELYDIEFAVGLAADSRTYGDDQMWGNDNDDRMWGQGGEDGMWGGAGDDYMEGNAASDWMSGGPEQDDMLGGTGPILSSDPSTAFHHPTDTSTLTRTVTVSSTTGVEVSRGDEMYGDEGADVMLGDNGIITRTLTAEGEWLTWVYSMSLDSFGAQLPRHPTGGAGSRVDRVVTMVDTAPGEIAGSDWMFGGAGDDDMYGQFDDTAESSVGDEMWGGEGEDAMLGDQGVVRSRVLVDPTQFIEPRQPFIDDHIYISGTLFREVELQWATGGDDRMRGGDDGDWMHGGAGDDLMNGNAGTDRMFGDDGADVMWGGPHHDHLWGGYGMDYLDVRPRVGLEGWPDDPLDWQEYGGEDHYQDVDYVYGGWDQDTMQANIGDEGPVVGDRLMDWVGAYNGYYLCPGLYGEFVVTRALSPSMIEFLQMLSEGDGAFTVTAPDASGWDELAMVYNTDTKDNAHPPHPDTPGHFVCDVVSPTVRVLGIDLTWSVKKEVYTVNGAVTVIDQLGALARRATVTVTWWITPTDGSELLVEEQVAETNSKGVASFTAPGSVAGTYTLVVEGVSLEGYVYDEANSVTSRSVSVPGKSGTWQAHKLFLPLLIR